MRMTLGRPVVSPYRLEPRICGSNLRGCFVQNMLGDLGNTHMRDDTTLDIAQVGQVVGTPWFCPKCGRGVIITNSPVPGLLLNKDGSVHKHEGKVTIAGYLDGNDEGTKMAVEFAARIDGTRKN
jgi:hypothetical protein